MKKSELKKLKSQSQVYFKKSALKFWDDKAFELTCVGGQIHEKNAEEYFIRKALGQGLPYTATVVYLMEDVNGDRKPEPGAKLLIEVGNLSDMTIVSHKDLKNVRN